MNRDGALAQRLRFPARSAHAVPPGVDVEDALFAEPTAVALRAVLRSGAGSRSRVLVVGGGTLGWLAAAVFLDLLDAEVAALEPDAGRMGGWRRWACARPGRRRSSTSCWRPAAAGAAWPRPWTGWAPAAAWS